MISNTSFFNTINNDSPKKNISINKIEHLVAPIKSKRSEEGSARKNNYTIDYSISNISNQNQTILTNTTKNEKNKEIQILSNLKKEKTKVFFLFQIKI